MIVGIDPGASGALAWLTDEGYLITVEDIPTIRVKVGTTMRTRIVAAGLAQMIERRRPICAFVEEVHARGTNGAIGNFQLGRADGLIEGALAALGVPIRQVPPKKWQRHHGLAHGDKGASRMRASQLWPGAAADFARVKDDGRAEAALIGAWGAAQMQQRGDIIVPGEPPFRPGWTAPKAEAL